VARHAAAAGAGYVLVELGLDEMEDEEKLVLAFGEALKAAGKQ
jgi:hypothetical protein